MWAGFAARGRTRLNSRKLNWTAPVKLTAVQPSPWLYRESTAPLGTKGRNKIKGEGPFPIRSRKKSPKRKQNKFKNNAIRGEGGAVKGYPISDESLVQKR